LTTEASVGEPKHRRHRWRAVLAACSLVGLLSGCTLSKHYGVNTTTVPVKGNCNTSRIEELGAALPLSGPDAALGKEYLDGVRLADTQINDTQGLTSKHACLELLYKDIGDNVHVGEQGVLDLVNSEVVQFLVAPFQSTVIQFTGSDLGLSGVPNTTFSSLNAPHQERNNYPMTFPTTAPDLVIGQALASYAAKQGWQTVAVAKLGDPAGQEQLASFKSAFEGKGGSISGTATISLTKHFTGSDLSRLRAGRPNALIVLGDTAQVGEALTARESLGWRVPTVVTSDGADASVVTQLNAPGKDGVSVLVPSRVVLPAKAKGPSDPTAVAFLRLLKRFLHVSTVRGSIVPYAAAYDGVEMLGAAVNSINSVSPGNLQTYLENANYQGVLASYNYTSTRHNGISAPSQLAVAALSSLSDGFFHAAPKVPKPKTTGL
jgi:ABC-type branched-subunit amino acid transport system substrate-binding protein